MARSVASPHRSSHPEERNGEPPLIAMDMCYMGQKNATKLMPIMVVREDSLGEVFAHWFQSKEVRSGEVHAGQIAYLVKSILSDIESVGYKRMVMKSDHESVLKALRVKAKQLFNWEISPPAQRNQGVGG